MTDEENGPRQRAAETKRKRTREQIVSAAIDLFDGLNQGDFTREQIAEEAGVGVATLHNHFRTKYEVLRAAYRRLIDPVTEPIIAGVSAGTYMPEDGLDELVRYVYAIAKLSHTNRALTASMVRAYFETPPDQRPELTEEWTQYHLFEYLGGPIAAQLHVVANWFFRHPVSGEAPGLGEEIPMATAIYHSNALLLELYHRAREDSAIYATQAVLTELLPRLVPNFDREANKELFDARFTRVQKKVEQHLEYVAKKEI